METIDRDFVLAKFKSVIDHNYTLDELEALLCVMSSETTDNLYLALCRLFNNRNRSL